MEASTLPSKDPSIEHCDPCPFFVDVNPQKRGVSISSVDSEPILRRQRHESPESGESGEDSDADRAYPHPDIALDVSDALTAEVPEEELTIPVSEFSEGHVAHLTSVQPSKKVLIAESADGALAMDIGTRLCLSTGEYIGTIASLLGPVQHAYYAILSKPQQIADLVSKGELQSGTALHYHLAHHKVIYDPMILCDGRKGTDASYINDEELPENVRPDFSDDEKELQWKRESKLRGREGSVSSEEQFDEDVAWPVEGQDVTSKGTDTTKEMHSSAGVVIPEWLR